MGNRNRKLANNRSFLRMSDRLLDKGDYDEGTINRVKSCYAALNDDHYSDETVLTLVSDETGVPIDGVVSILASR